MRAAWYERNGPAREVLTVGEMPDPVAGPGEVLVRIHASGVNPSDVKSRQGTRGPMAFPRIIPQSDGAGIIAAVGEGVAASRIGQRGAQRGNRRTQLRIIPDANERKPEVLRI